MNLPRRAARIALLAGFLVAIVALGIHPSQAVSKVEAGSWWAGQPDAGGAPVPPTVPDGGVWVEMAGTETTAMSAVRVTLDEGDAAPVLTLKVHQSSQQSVNVIACPTSDDWKPVTAGPMSQAPKGDCTKGAATGVPSADGTTMSFDLGGFDTAGMIDVVLVPGPTTVAPAVPAVGPLASAPAPPAVNGFDITFEAPDTSTVAVVANPAPAATPAADDSAAYSDPTPFTDSVATTFSDPGYTYTPAAPAVVVAPPAPRPKAAPRAALPAPRRIVPASVAVPTTRDGAQAIAAFALVALIAYAVIDGRRLVPAAIASRGRATLYDWPPPPTLETPAESRREGSPPALR